jgi:hypothetical protein
MRQPTGSSAAPRECDFWRGMGWLAVAFARGEAEEVGEERRGGSEQDAVPPALGSLHPQSFPFCRGQLPAATTTPLYSSKNSLPSSVHCKLLHLPTLVLVLCSSSASRSRRLWSWLPSSFFRSFLVRLFVSAATTSGGGLYICCIDAPYKWHTPRGLAFTAVTVIFLAVSLQSFVFSCCCCGCGCRRQHPCPCMRIVQHEWILRAASAIICLAVCCWRRLSFQI